MLSFPNITKDQAYTKTRSFYKSAYINAIRTVFYEIYEEVLKQEQSHDQRGSTKTFIIYVDKNHPLNDSSQAPVHRRFRNISEFDKLKFISINLKAKEVLGEDKYRSSDNHPK